MRQEHEIVTADDVLKKLREGVKEAYEIRLRGMKVPVRLLSITEVNEIRHDAKRYVATAKHLDETDENLYKQRCTLILASTTTKDKVPVLSEKILDQLPTNDIIHLYTEYMKVVEDVNPQIERIEPGQFRALVEALKKNSITSSDLNLVQLRAICSAYQDLIQRLETQEQQMGN